MLELCYDSAVRGSFKFHGLGFFRIHFFLLLNLCVFSVFANVNRFVYEEQPNDGTQTIKGVLFGNEFLGPFQYIVEVEELFTRAEVEVVFYNQFGQILNSSQIKHAPFNSTVTPEPLVTKSPTLSMYEGRSQLLAWARTASGPEFVQEINGTGVIIPRLTDVRVGCRSSTGGPCTITFNPGGNVFTPINGTPTPSRSISLGM